MKFFTAMFWMLSVMQFCVVQPFVAHSQEVKESPHQSSQIPRAVITIESKRNFELGEAIILQTSLKNRSDKAFLYIKSSLLSDWQIELKDGQENKVPFTRWGRDLSLSSIFANIRLTLTPEQEEKDEIPLNRIYDMTKGGNYTVIVKRDVSLDDGKTYQEIRSPVLRLHVAETQVNPPVVRTIADFHTTKIAARTNPTSLWRTGDSWQVLMTLFSGKPQADMPAALEFFGTNKRIADAADPYHVFAQYFVTISLKEVKKVDERRRWEVEFKADEAAPVQVRNKVYKIIVDENGKVEQITGNDQEGIVVVGDMIVSEYPLYGFPLDFFFPLTRLEGKERMSVEGNDGVRRLLIEKQTSRDAIVVSAKMQAKKAQGEIEDWFVLTQRWQNGAKWWNETRKINAGVGIGFAAKLVEPALQRGLESDGFSISVRAEQSLIEPGYPLAMQVILHNSSVQERKVRLNVPSESTFVEVKNERGEVMPLTELGKEILKLNTHGVPDIKLAAKHQIQQSIVLNSLYDMTRSGLYNVSVTQQVQSQNGQISKIVSGELKVQVVDR